MRMNMFWMIATLVAMLLVIAASFAAAVTADAVSRRAHRHAPRPAEDARTGPVSRALTAEWVHAGREWPRVATGAWTICVAASVIAIAVVGALILVA
ncbi:hypothetical protein M2275_006849 [Rhodococcus opacus]|nr:hypothetical protein [Rhodococcus opacus]